MQSETVGSAVEGAPPRAGKREWIGLAVIFLPTMLYTMDLTVLHLAVPALSAALSPTSSQLLWIMDIYGFLIAGSLITMGTLGDRIGRRKLLLIGAAAFGLASILAAFSTSAEMLIATRALLGLAGATLAPSTLSLIRGMFHDPGQRTFAIGVWVAGFSAGAAIGPLLGGVMLEHFWWGSVFLIGVPVMLLLLVLGPFLLPEYKDPDAGRLDLLSAALSLVAVLAVIFGLKQIAVEGIGWMPALSLAAGVAVGGIFLRRQRHLADPLLDPGLFANRAFSGALGTYTLALFVMFGVTVFTAQYLQLVIGLSPLAAGLWSLPSAVTFIAGSLLAPALTRWASPRMLVVTGLVIAAIGAAMLTRVGVSSLPLVVIAGVIMASGLTPVVTLMTDMIISTAPPERAGAAAGLSETGAELGGALGIAILGSIGAAVYRRDVIGDLPASVPPEAAAAARETLGGAVAAAGQLSAPVADGLLTAARDAFIQGMQTTALIAAIGTAATAIVASILLRAVPAHPEPERQADPEIDAPPADSGESSRPLDLAA